MNRRLIAWLVGATALALGGFAAYATLGRDAPRPAFEAVDITGVDWGRDFTLTDTANRKRSLADFRGKAVVIFFGYTHCPDLCPTTLARMGEAIRLLGEDAPRVQGLFVTVDPQRDTREVLAQYVPAFHPSFLGLYADADTTARTAKEFKVFFHAQAPNEHGSYTVDHSGQMFVFDPAGRLRLLVKSDAAPQSMARDLRTLLKEHTG